MTQSWTQKVQLMDVFFPNNIHIWDPWPTVRPGTCTRHLTFTQTHWHAQVLTTFLLHSCTRRQESINNPFESDPVGFSVWNFEHPAIVLSSKTHFSSYPKWSVPLTTPRPQRLHVSVSRSAYPGPLMDYRCELIRANKCATAEQLPVPSSIEVTGTEWWTRGFNCWGNNQQSGKSNESHNLLQSHHI